VIKNNLFYKGPKPKIEYYVENNQINESKVQNYNNLPDIFNTKEDCLK
jgi:hypothetical protein